MLFRSRRVMSQQQNNWPFIFNVGNSIIGVTLLAMPFCFQQCGIILGSLMLFLSTWLTIKSCQLLVKAGIASRRRSFSLLAYFTHGAVGKLMVELCMIGLQLGTLVAQVVVIGDLGPAILSKVTGFENTHNLRTSLIVGLCLFVALPLGLLKDLRTLNKASTMCILFYTFVVFIVVMKAVPNLYTGIWYAKIRLWRMEGFFKCLPIFSFAFGCQTQIFIVYNTLAEPSLKRINSIISSAVLLCTAAYLLVAFFGYIAFCDEVKLSGDIFNHFQENLLSDTLKLCFVIAIAVSIPLIVFPCRASLYTLLFPQKHKDDEPGIAKIPEQHFQIITTVIIVGAMVTAILIPNVELVLGLTGATMGTMICYIFPALFFMHVMSDGSEGRFISKIVLISGLTVLIASTYTTLKPTEPVPVISLDKDVVDTGINMADLVDKKDIVDDVKRDVVLANIDTKNQPPDAVDNAKRQEPPIPEAPDDTQNLKKQPEETKIKEQDIAVDDKLVINKDVNADMESLRKKADNADAVDETKKGDGQVNEDEKKPKQEDPKNEGEPKEDEEKKKEEERKKEEEKKIEEVKKQEDEKKRVEAEKKQEQILNKLEQQQEEQEKLINEQKKILEYLKEHKDEHKDAPVKQNVELPQQGQNVGNVQPNRQGDGLIQNQGLVQNAGQQQGLLQAQVPNQQIQGQANMQQQQQQPQLMMNNQNLINQPINAQMQNQPIFENAQGNLQGNLQQPDQNQLNIGQNLNQNLGQNIGQNLNQNVGQNLNQNLGQNLNQNVGQNLNQNLGLNVGQNGILNQGQNVLAQELNQNLVRKAVVQNPAQNLVAGQQVGNQFLDQGQQLGQQQTINQQNLGQKQQLQNVVQQQEGKSQQRMNQESLNDPIDPQRAQEAILNSKLKDQRQLNLKVQDEENMKIHDQNTENLNADLDGMGHRGKRDVISNADLNIEQQNHIESNKDAGTQKNQNILKSDPHHELINGNDVDTIVEKQKESGIKVGVTDDDKEMEKVIDNGLGPVKEFNGDVIDKYVNVALQSMKDGLKFEESQRMTGIDVQDTGKLRRR